MSLSKKPASVESTTDFAPWSRSSFSWTALRTTFTNGTPSASQIRTSIWPRLEAAAVWTKRLMAFAPHRLDHAERRQRIDEGRSSIG